MIFSTSNKTKIEEFKKYIPALKFINGPDIKEVAGDYLDVIIYKSKDMGPGFLVEDTILIVNGIEVVDIKWKIDELKENDKAKWITTLAFNDGQEISVYKGSIDGVITKKKGSEGFAFDPYFIPIELMNKNMLDFDINYDLQGLTLAELDNLGFKYLFSARKKAIDNLKKNKSLFIKKLKEIPEWTGSYQNS